MSSPTLPTTQRAAILTGAYGAHHDISSIWPVPEPLPDEVLIRISASGICSGDINPRDGYPPAGPVPNRPLVTGHEGLGYIVGVGSDSHDTLVNRFKIGDRVEYVAVPASDVIQIPTVSLSIHDTALAPLLCAGGTALGAVRTANVSPGAWLCVSGAAGGVGSLAVRYGKHLGYRVIAIDSQTKEDHCKALGADSFVGYEEKDLLVERVRSVASKEGEEGVMGVVICSASAISYQQAIEYAGIGATIVSVAPTMIQFHTGHLMHKGLKIFAQSNGTKQDIEDALSLGAEGILPRTEIVPLQKIDAALDSLKAGKVVGRMVIDFE